MSGIYQLRLNYVDGSGNPSQNVLHYILDELGAFNAHTYAQRLLDGWVTANGPTLGATLANDVTLNTVDAKRVYPVGSVTAFNLYNTAGSEGTNSVGNSLGPILSFYTAETYNRNARMFLPAGPVDGIIESKLQPAYVTLLTALGVQLLSPITLSGGAGAANLALYQRKVHVAHLVNLVQVLPHVGSLSKRLRPY
jgi:hypothetical protein